MAGNVWEWTADWYDNKYYQESSERNPQGPSSGKYRVLRGGSWGNRPILIRSALRNWPSPSLRNDYVGFRCAQTYSAPKRMAKEISGKDGAPMVLIPEGEFLMGSTSQDIDRVNGEEKYPSRYDSEQPQHQVHLDAFYMDQYEVTTSRYGGFMRTSGRDAPKYWKSAKQAGRTEKPVVGVDWNDANAYCEHYGKRLPTEAEWEKAARGTDGRMYPWGNEGPTPRRANAYHGAEPIGLDLPTGYSVIVPVGRRAAGKSPYGVHAMAGNVAEWVADWYEEFYYDRSPARNPTGPSSGVGKVYRGCWHVCWGGAFDPLLGMAIRLHSTLTGADFVVPKTPRNPVSFRPLPLRQPAF